MLSNTLMGATRNFLTKHGPAVALFAGSIGFIATNVITAKAAVKAEKAIQARKEELKVEELSKKEELKIKAKEYVKPVALGAVATGMIFLGGSKYAKLEAGLTSACTLANANYQKYKTKIDSIIGKSFGTTDSVYEPIVVYDEFEDEVFETTLIEFYDARYCYNEAFSDNGWVSLNDFKQLLSRPCTIKGEDYGFGQAHVYDKSGRFWINIDLVKDEENRWVMRYGVCPETGYKNN